MDKEFLKTLKHSWSATVILNNGQEIDIWYTAFPMSQNIIQSVVSVSSDYPKHEINYNFGEKTL